jgi:hypothetical protein
MQEMTFPYDWVPGVDEKRGREIGQRFIGGLREAEQHAAVTAALVDEGRRREQLLTDVALVESECVPDFLVTALQVSGLVQRSKKTIERYSAAGKIPPPKVTPGRGSGQANLWSWQEIREPLQRALGRDDLPARFPADLRT